MSNFARAVKALDEVDEHIDHLADNDSYVVALEAAGLLAPDPRVIRTQEELEALELEDADAIVVAGESGAVRTVRAFAAMHRLGSVWGLPAAVVATGKQVREAREAMEKDTFETEEAANNAYDPYVNRPMRLLRRRVSTPEVLPNTTINPAEAGSTESDK